MTATTTSIFEPIPWSLWKKDPKAFSDRLGASFRETGFAVINQLPIDQAVIDRGIDAGKKFFALPDEIKRKYFIPGGGGQRAYTPFATEVAKGAKAKDLKEFWHVARELPKDHKYAEIMGQNLYVAEVPGWKEATNGMFNALDAFGLEVLSAIAMNLKLPPRFFDDTVKDGNSILRLLHYPPQMEPPPEGSVRAGAHEDINVITLLLGAEEGGLEVLHRNGSWIPVNPPPGSLVVNVGDMLQRLTNHVLPSTTHRVVNPKPERSRFPRYSTPYFLHFRPDYEIETLASCITSDRPNRYPEPLGAQDFLEIRLKEIGLRM
ncbi:MAG TPA: 2OG-Fe(II) oxygenase family protein [Hyphomonadaceae bacterium]|nr:2OG-Fe(II) oxygenase family protein [Hyphomonadaceae bacterium]